MGILNLFTLLIVILIVNCGDAPPTVATPISVDFIELNLKSVTIQQGSSTTLTATVTVTGNADTTVVWYSSDTSIATVDSSGVVVGKAVGSVQIKAISTVTDTIFSESEITVEALPSVTSVEVISVGGSVVLAVNGTTQLRSIVDVISGASESVEWSTNASPSVLTVSATGLVTGVGSGSGMITATSTFDNTKSGSITITVSLDRMAAEVTSVRIDSPSSSNIEVGGRLTLTATVTEERGASTLLTWSSSDTSIATVNSGIVTGISVGEVTIKATSIVTPEELDNIDIIIVVNNVPVSVTGLSVIPQVLVGNAISGSPQQLTVTVSPLDHTAGTVTYTSTDTTKASVDGSGLVTFLSQGAIEINVAVGGFIVTVPVTVLREIIPAITSITIDSRLDTIYNYGRQSDPDFSHQIVTVDGATDSVVWSSSDSSIVMVDSTGVVRGVTGGKAIIRVTSVFDPTKYAEIPIHIKSRPELISDLSVTTTLVAGNWASSGTAAENIARITDGDTLTTGNNDGEVSIRNADGHTLTFTLDRTYTDGILIYYSTSNGLEDATIDFILEGVVQDSIMVDRYWELRRIHGDGVPFTIVPSIQFDEVKITFEGGWQALYEVGILGAPVLLEPASVTSVQVISVGGSVVLAVNGTTQLQSIVDVISGASESVEWSTNALPSVLTVSATGLVTGVGSGSGMITATSTFDSTKSGSITITVSPDLMAAEVTSVSIDSPSSSNIEVGGRLTLTATVTEERGASTLLTWSSSATSIATVNNSGIVTGISVGEVTIKATSIVTPEELDIIVIRVNNAVAVTGLSVTPQDLVDTAISSSPQQQQLIVTVSPPDHTAGSVTYTSTDITKASVDESGLVTFLSEGAIEIKVAVGGFIVTVPVTVLREIIPAITSITIESRLDTIYNSGSQSDPDFSYEIVAVDGATDSVVWSSSDSSIATVDSIGFVRGITGGEVMIRVTSVFDPTKYAEKLIVVRSRPVLISDISVITTTLVAGNWASSGTAAENIARITDGNKLKTGKHPDDPGLDNDGQVAIRNSNEHTLTFTLDRTYTEGKLIYYNRGANNGLQDSDVEFILEGVVQVSFVTSRFWQLREIHEEDVPFTAVENIQFDEVKITFEGGWQGFREIEIFGVPVL